MKLAARFISIGVLAGAAVLAAVKLVDYAYDKISGRYITFTGKDLRHIPDPKDKE